jgi:hypothetical protein
MLIVIYYLRYDKTDHVNGARREKHLPESPWLILILTPAYKEKTAGYEEVDSAVHGILGMLVLAQKVDARTRSTYY